MWTRMSRPKKQDTEVISFRVPKEVFKRVDRTAKKAKKNRATFVADLFLPTFEQLVTAEKQTA